MGFLAGVMTGIAAAAVAAAWYMSRSGEQFREQYHVEQRLGELGDQLESRTRDIQTQVNAQLADVRTKAEEVAGSITSNGNGSDAGEALDAVTASAAEAAAELAAEADTTVTKGKKAVKDAVEDATE